MMGMTAKSVMALALVALVSAAVATHHNKYHNQKQQDWMSQKFEAGREYHFRYDAQTSTGYSSMAISRQRAVNRLQSLVKIVFQTPTEATLSMRQIRTVQLSEVPAINAWDPARLQPINAFENRVLPSDHDEQSDEIREFNAQLALPVTFRYNEDGIVEAIRFKKSESTTTKNIKKAVLNLIQLNLRPTKQENIDYDEQLDNKKALRNIDSQELNENWVGNSYTNVENTIEGQCEVTYAISPNVWQNKNQRQHKWNVTKSIDFERCSVLADVAYGFQLEPIVRSQNFQQNWKQQDVYASKKNSLEQEQRYGQVIPKERLDRSTVMRFVLAAPQTDEEKRQSTGSTKKFGIERVELLSEYTVQNHQLRSNHAMQTVAVAELVFLKSVENSKVDSSEEFSKRSNYMNGEESPEETLLYNADFESLEKKFMMFGDDNYPENTKLAVSRLFIFDQSKDDVAEQGQKMLNIAERQLDAAVRSFVMNDDNNAEGINGPKTAENLWNLVYIMRICTVNGLKQLHQRCTAASKDQKSTAVARELFANALALAGTRNTIAYLVEMIKERVIDEFKASQVLKTLGSGAGLPAPSENQVDLVLGLCKSDTLQSESLKRSCWLTFGTMVGELNMQSEKAKNLYETETPAKNFESASAHKMDFYRQVLLHGLENADKKEDAYAKIIALKAIGNAGLTSTIDRVMKIVQDAEIKHDIRLHAIDALRRICHRQPESYSQIEALLKVQHGLLPVFQNVHERSDIRMATAAMLLTNAVVTNTPSKHALIDQIVYAIQHDKNEDVAGFVAGILEGLTQSPIYEHHKIAEHLKNSLKLVKLTSKSMKRVLQGSQYTRRVSPCCHESRVRFFLNFVNIYASDRSDAKYFSAESKSKTKVLPSQMAVELDSFVDGHYQRNSLEINVIQNNFDAILKELLSQVDDDKFNYENEEQTSATAKNAGFLSNAAQQINSLFRKLNIKDRHEQNGEESQITPYAFITIRNNDFDVLVEPITAEDILSVLKVKSSAGNLQKLRSSVAHAIRRISSSFSGSSGIMHLNTAISLDSKFARIPTSLGMPLKVCQGGFLFGSLKLKNEQGQQEESEILSIQPNLNYVEQQYMRVWMAPSAGVSAGVAWYRAAELNLPLEVEIKTVQVENMQESIKQQSQTVISFRLPQRNLRVLGLHTLPSVFLSWKSVKQVDRDETSNGVQFKQSFDQMDATIQPSVIEVPIHNEQLSQQQREIDTTVLKSEKISLPFRIHGLFHSPREWTVAELVKITKTSENSIHIDFTPVEGETPREIKFTINSDMYQSISNKKNEQIESQPWGLIRNRLEEFYGKFENNFFNENNDGQFLNSKEQEQKLNKEWNKEERGYGNALKLTHQYMQKNMAKSVSYKHSLKVACETVGGRRQLKADSEVIAVCDSKFRACELSLEVTRSPLLSAERQPWTMELQAQSAYPETILNVQELDSATSAQKRHLKLFAHVQARWGVPTEKKSIKINLLGEPSEEMIRQAINANNKHQLRLRDAKRRGESEYRIQEIESERPMQAFIDRFHTVVEYQFGAFEQNIVSRLIETLKTNYFWNTKSELNAMPYSQTQSQLIKATLRVDSFTRRHANFSLETPTQRILIQSLELPVMYNLELVANRRESLIFDHSSPNPMARFFSRVMSHNTQQQADERLKECTVGRDTDISKQNTIKTFDGVTYNVPISKCYTVLAKDCTNVDRQPVYAVLGKQYGKANEKTIKVISKYGTFEIEPISENSKTLQIIYNGKTYTLASASAEDLEELDRHGIVFNNNGDEEYVTILVPTALFLEFNGRTVQIQLSEEYKNTQCGLCGHYDDTIEDEFRMSDNQLTNDIKKFHRSFSVQEDANCSSNDFEDFYAKGKFSMKTEKNEKKANKFSKMAKQQQMASSNEEATPVEQTIVFEYNQKVCFSLKAVAQCPKGWYSADLSGEQDLLKRTKVQFACVERSSIEARRLKKIVHHVGFVDMSDYAPSYSELMVLPERCIQY